MTTEGSIGGMGSGTGSGMGTSDSSLVGRMMRAARLDVSLYEEVEADRNATSQAATVVGISAISSAIGGAIAAAIFGAGGGVIGAILGGIISAFLGWVMWSYIAYFVGTSVFGGTATPGELLRTVGFAQAPGALGILVAIPFLGVLIGFALWVWSVVAGVIALRQALDIDTTKAIVTAVIAAIPYLLLSMFIRALLPF
ncbi:MAG TPA: YIP1 family protein [Chloroflexota bacterium]|nr:YIP1 family protein [Chloroflexota bacterium]